jgi:type II secretory pathway pseudopilin PulG
MSERENGQTLLEVLVALAAVIIILSAITTAALLSLRQSVGSSSETRASQLAQEGLELMKSQVGTISQDTLACLGDTGTLEPVTACQDIANLEQTYRRTVSVTTDPTQCATLKKVTVTVFWNDAVCRNQALCHTTPLTTCL